MCSIRTRPRATVDDTSLHMLPHGLYRTTGSVTRAAPSESHETWVSRTRARATSMAFEGPGIPEKDAPVVFKSPHPLPPILVPNTQH